MEAGASASIRIHAGTGASSGAARAAQRCCWPRDLGLQLSAQRFKTRASPRCAAPHAHLDIFHIIGNVTGTGRTLHAEFINDVSAVVMHGGLYHAFHQCCSTTGTTSCRTI